MEIRSFKVERFRSISSATLDLGDLTVLVGPNNEGKSNILRAMVLGMSILSGFARVSGSRYVLRSGLRGPVDYEWERDFPLDRRSGKKLSTAIEFEFELSDLEIDEFAKVIGSKINGTLRVRLTLSRDEAVTFRVIKQKVGGAWTRKADEIAEFVGRRAGVEYVPSVRTAQEASAVVARLVASELRALERDTNYQKAVATIQKLQEPRLAEIAKSVQDTLQHFLPDVANVEISLPEPRRQFAAARSVEIHVDDGHRTLLETKGDGAQSLAAIALLRRAAMDSSRSETFVLAVEEPEAHLHPFAIWELRRVLTQIALDQQVVVTTHSPLLADPFHVERNVIVEGSRARTAKRISDVRESLGVRLQDNLQSARLALVVEGLSDKRVLEALLQQHSRILSDHLTEGVLVVESLGGGAKLNYRLSQYASGVCGVFVVLDDDAQGRSSIQGALREGLIEVSEYRLTTADGKAEAELEDLIEPMVYLDRLNGYLGLQLKPSDIKKGKRKWTDRLGALIANKGKVWDSPTEKQVKTLVADAVRADPGNAIEAGVTLVEDLAAILSSRLGSDE